MGRLLTDPYEMTVYVRYIRHTDELINRLYEKTTEHRAELVSLPHKIATAVWFDKSAVGG